MASNCIYFSNIIYIKLKLQLKASKIKLYKILIKILVCYGAEIKTLSKADTNKLKIFDRKLVQKNKF